MNALTMLQFATVLLTGLVAGLFYSYDYSVIKGLGNLSDDKYLAGFQSINREIQNPFFFLSFMGALIVLPVAAWICWRDAGAPVFYFMLAATIIYVTGVFLTTVAGNVPLNNMLDRIDISSASPETLASVRKEFERSWNAFNHVRTAASILAFAATLISVFKRL